MKPWSARYLVLGCILASLPTGCSRNGLVDVEGTVLLDNQPEFYDVVFVRDAYARPPPDALRFPGDLTAPTHVTLGGRASRRPFGLPWTDAARFIRHSPSHETNCIDDVPQEPTAPVLACETKADSIGAIP